MSAEPKEGVKPFVYLAVGIAAFGGLLFGYDTGVISGAILFIKKQFSLSATMEEIVVSAVLVGAVIGAVMGGALTGRFGRRKMIVLAGIIFTVSAIATALAPTVICLVAARIVSGIGIGVASFISPMYIAELVPAKVRGSLVAVNMLAITTGIVVAYLVDYALSGIQGWRYMFGLAAIPSIILVVAMWWLPGGAGLAIVMWFFHVLAIFLLDRVGRRPLLLVGVAGQVVGLAILGAAFHFQQLANLKSYIAIGSLVIYVSCFAFGLGPIFWLLISEIYPLKVRGAAMSAVTVTNWALNLAVAVTFLTLVAVLGHAGTFWLYGVIAVGAWFFLYLLVPETKGKTLEQIEEHWRSGKPARAL